MTNAIRRQDGDLSEEYQSFIQVLSQSGIYPDDEFQSAFHRITGNPSSPELIEDLNKALAEVELIIKQLKCEITGIKYWVFASTTINDDNDDDDNNDQVDEVNQENYDDDFGDEEVNCVWFSKAKLELLKMIIQVIVITSNEKNCISKNDCINLVSSMKNIFSRTNADKFLKQMIHGSWLVSLDGYVYLGVRGIVELMPYLKSENPNLKNCHLCKQTVIYGQLCQGCDRQMHLYCLVDYFKITGGGKHQQCPGCSKNLKVNNQVMARLSNNQESVSEDDYQVEESAPGPSGSSRSVRRSHRRI